MGKWLVCGLIGRPVGRLVGRFVDSTFRPINNDTQNYTGAPDTQALEAVFHARFLPNAVLLHHDPSAPAEEEAILPEVIFTWRGHGLFGGRFWGVRDVYLNFDPLDPKLKSNNQVARACEMVGGKATAYVCQNRVCGLPISDPQALAERLDRNQAGAGGGGLGGQAGLDVAALLKGEKKR